MFLNSRYACYHPSSQCVVSILSIVDDVLYTESLSFLSYLPSIYRMCRRDPHDRPDLRDARILCILTSTCQCVVPYVRNTCRFDSYHPSFSLFLSLSSFVLTLRSLFLRYNLLRYFMMLMIHGNE